MEFKLIEKKLSLGPVANEYADVHFHIEDKEEKTFSTLKANKVILALHSPYFHRGLSINNISHNGGGLSCQGKAYQ
jgi:hypothetical protein